MLWRRDYQSSPERRQPLTGIDITVVELLQKHPIESIGLLLRVVQWLFSYWLKPICYTKDCPASPRVHSGSAIWLLSAGAFLSLTSFKVKTMDIMIWFRKGILYGKHWNSGWKWREKQLPTESPRNKVQAVTRKNRFFS